MNFALYVVSADCGIHMLRIEYRNGLTAKEIHSHAHNAIMQWLKKRGDGQKLDCFVNFNDLVSNLATWRTII